MTIAQPAAAAAPVQEKERIHSIDALRGFALLGILVMNIQSFAMIGAAYLNPTAYGNLEGINLWVWVLSHIFADQKFISIFSMLFGAGILLMTERAEAKGAKPAGLHYRRMGWMILFGLMHAHLLWYGDILFTYGVSGLWVYLLRRKSPRTLIVTGVAVAAVGSLIFIGSGVSMAGWPAEAVEAFETQGWRPTAEAVQRELATFRGSWLEQMPLRSAEALFFETGLFLLIMGWKCGSLMLFGMALYKLGAFHASWPGRSYVRMILLGALAGLPLVIYGVLRNFAAAWDVRYSFFLGSQFNYWGSYLVALSWVGVLMLLCQAGKPAGLLRRFEAVGRTAFSNYILLTVICTTLFYGHGFGLFGSVERIGQLGVVVGVWIVQLLLAPWWLQRFQFGPLEWLWRSLTYWKAQPFRRT